MSFVIFLIYLSLSFIRLPEMFPAMASWRLMLVLGAVGTLVSFFSFATSGAIAFEIQTVLAIGFVFILAFSQAVNGWVGGGLQAIANFSIPLALYLMLVWTTRELKQLRLVLGLTVVLSIVLTLFGVLGVSMGFMGDKFVLLENEGASFLPRIRALGPLNDPNDFAQVLIIAIVALGAFWAPRRSLRNLALLGPPAAWLILGIYLTHSRGAIIGLATAIVFALQKKLGKLLSLAAAGFLFLALLAANFAGGRALSSSEASAATRIDYWAEGLMMFRENPVFGVGYRNFPDENNGHAAHNSFIQCAAELGITGYVVWMAIIVITIMGLTHIQSIPYEEKPGAGPPIQKYARVVRTALYTYLVTGWFLSRAYTETLFMLLACGVALIVMARRMGIYKQPLPLTSLMARSVGVAIGTLVLLKVMITVGA